MQLNRLYKCKHCTEGFVGALEHWREYFQCQDDDYAHELVEMFNDKIHDVEVKLKRYEEIKENL